MDVLVRTTTYVRTQRVPSPIREEPSVYVRY